MWINVRRVLRLRCFVEVVHASPNAPESDTKINVAAEFGRVVPRIARIGDLIVPPGRRSRTVAAYQRALTSAALIEGVNNFSNFQRISCAKPHVCGSSVATAIRVTDGVGSIPPNPGKFDAIRCAIISKAAYCVSFPLVSRKTSARDGYGTGVAGARAGGCCCAGEIDRRIVYIPHA